MRIIVDINHPAHVHYFKHFIWEMENRGHKILITASEKDISYDLLDLYHLPSKKIGSYGNNILTKGFNIIKLDLKFLSAVLDFNPDIMLGFASIRVAHISRIIKKPGIIIDDTDHAKISHLLYEPFANTIITPSFFKKDFGKKQIRFHGVIEMSYLHPKYFAPDPRIYDDLNLAKNEKFIIMRFVSWSAIHDIGQSGFFDKISLVKQIKSFLRVFVSSEEELPTEIEKYRLPGSPDRIHDVLYFADLYVGEGATMAVEAALLGTHALYINSLTAGTIEAISKYSILEHINPNCHSPNIIINRISELLNIPEQKMNDKIIRDTICHDMIDVTEFLIEFFENYNNTDYIN